MTRSKFPLAVLALGFSFGPAFAESGETNPRLIAPISEATMAPLVEGRQALAMVTSGPSEAQRFVIDRNAVESHRH